MTPTTKRHYVAGLRLHTPTEDAVRAFDHSVRTIKSLKASQSITIHGRMVKRQSGRFAVEGVGETLTAEEAAGIARCRLSCYDAGRLEDVVGSLHRNASVCVNGVLIRRLRRDYTADAGKPMDLAAVVQAALGGDPAAEEDDDDVMQLRICPPPD